MRRIVVVGCPGSGKTSFAIGLGRKTGLPVVHLDVLYWKPGWEASKTAEFRERLTEAVVGPNWIVDGSFAEFAFDLTLARADMLVMIDRPRLLCQWRILWRSAFERSGVRPDLPKGCPEKFDWKLMREAWRYDAERRPAIEAERLKQGPDVPVVRLDSDMEIKNFLNAYPVSEQSPHVISGAG